MRRAILVAAILAMSGCGGDSSSGGGSAGGSPTNPVNVTWTTSAAGVECSGADVDHHAMLPWENLDGDAFDRYMPTGEPDEGDVEDTIVCTWWCGTLAGSEAVSVAAFFNVRAGVWAEAAVFESRANCW